MSFSWVILYVLSVMRTVGFMVSTIGFVVVFETLVVTKFSCVESEVSFSVEIESIGSSVVDSLVIVSVENVAGVVSTFMESKIELIPSRAKFLRNPRSISSVVTFSILESSDSRTEVDITVVGSAVSKVVGSEIADSEVVVSRVVGSTVVVGSTMLKPYVDLVVSAIVVAKIVVVITFSMVSVGVASVKISCSPLLETHLTKTINSNPLFKWTLNFAITNALKECLFDAL